MANKTVAQPALAMREMAEKAIAEQLDKAIPELFEIIISHAKCGNFSCEYRHSNKVVIQRLIKHLSNQDFGYFTPTNDNPYTMTINW